MMRNIILCGGNGTRLWPISRTLMPKQFAKLFSNRSLFQLTVQRNSKVCKTHFIVSNAQQYFLAYDQLEELNKTDNNFLLEAIAKNTAPAIAMACFALDPEETVLVTPSDHLIKDQQEYEKAIHKAGKLAEKDYLVTFGIKPDSAQTGFGYIEAQGEDVIAFHEKPDKERAKLYVQSGNYYWNSGMFCFKAAVFLSELKKISPVIYETCFQAFHNAKKDGIIRIQHNDSQHIPQDSIDYAVMEKSSKVKVVPADMGWSDVGSFDALYEQMQKDKNGNTLNQNHIPVDSTNNLIYAEERKVATVDIDDCIVIDTADALLICKKGSSQKVKQVVEKIKQEDLQLHNIHLTGYRPWGRYRVLEESNGYKIKKIEVKPGKRLSLQKHFHRNEHWIVVSGTATVTVEEKSFLIRPNESTYIKAGQIHRLANEGKLPLILIEVQVGEYTGEDDIVRLDDDYQRGEKKDG